MNGKRIPRPTNEILHERFRIVPVAGPTQIPATSHYVTPFAMPVGPGRGLLTVVISPETRSFQFSGGGVTHRQVIMGLAHPPVIVCGYGESVTTSTTGGVLGSTIEGVWAIWGTVRRLARATTEMIQHLGVEIASMAWEVIATAPSDPFVTMRRAQWKLERKERRDAERRVDDGDKVLAHMADTAMTTEEIILGRTVTAGIRSALNQKEFIAWQLKDEGYSQREIAARMKVHESRVSQWIASARTKLRRDYENA